MKDASKPIDCESCGGSAERAYFTAPSVGTSSQTDNSEERVITNDKNILTPDNLADRITLINKQRPLKDERIKK